MTVLLVALGAAVGAPLRYLTDRMIKHRHRSTFPWGTLVVNAVGSLILGLLTTAAGLGVLPREAMALLGVGFCGALTTYSTFGYETVKLAEAGAWFQAAANVAVSVVAGIGSAFCGATIALACWG